MSDSLLPAARRGRLFVLSGPSGVGKDTVLTLLHTLLPDIQWCVTATTRPKRDGEVHGKNYFFLSVEEFHRMVEENGFLEYAHVNGKHLYGTPRAWVEEQRNAGRDVLLKIDVQGGLNVKQLAPEAILLFLLPPSWDELERRLRMRNTESEDQILIRLLDARNELQQMSKYEYAVLNDTVENAAQLVRTIILAERARIPKGSTA
jgi:guanylate kinase